MITLADGSCPRCGHINTNVLLTGENKLTSDGGTLWKVADGMICVSCGARLVEFYEPPIILELPPRKETAMRS